MKKSVLVILFVCLVFIPFISASDRVGEGKGSKQSPTLTAVRQFAALTLVVARGQESTIAKNIDYEIIRDDQGEIVEINAVIDTDGVGHYFVAKPSERGFVVEQHLSTGEGGVADVVSANDVCFSFQDGKSVRLVCLCRTSAQEPWHVCFDSKWLPAVRIS